MFNSFNHPNNSLSGDPGAGALLGMGYPWSRERFSLRKSQFFPPKSQCSLQKIPLFPLRKSQFPPSQNPTFSPQKISIFPLRKSHFSPSEFPNQDWAIPNQDLATPKWDLGIQKCIWESQRIWRSQNQDWAIPK